MPRSVVGLLAAVRTATSAFIGRIRAPRSKGGSMPRSVVGVFAAAGTAMSVLVALVHGGVAIVVIAAVAGAAAGLATYLASPSSKKKILSDHARILATVTMRGSWRHFASSSDGCQSAEVRRARFGPGLRPGPRRQARWVGRAPGSTARRRRVPRSGMLRPSNSACDLPKHNTQGSCRRDGSCPSETAQDRSSPPGAARRVHDLLDANQIRGGR